MFAVPGWNVAAQSLVQEQHKPVKDKSNGSLPTSHTRNKPPANGNKRKRDQDSKTQGLSPPSIKTSALSADKLPRPQLSNFPSGSSNLDHSIKKRSRKEARTTSLAATNDGPAEPIGGANSAKKTLEPPRKHQKEATRKANGMNGDKDFSRAIRNAAEEDVEPASLPPMPPAPTHLTPLQAKMRAKLTSARFRHLNETLYTSSSSDALKLFSNSPDLFAEYHAGFSQQVRDAWPQNPVNVYIESIKLRATLTSPVNNTAPLPRRKPGVCTIADLGCGDAPLARGLQSVVKKLNLKLRNFDLHAANSHVTVADISTLPLRDGEVDIAIFCLSLMGTNWLAFVEETWRILRNDGKGEVWVAEVKSRFGRASSRTTGIRVVENSVGKRRKPQAGKVTQATDNLENNNSAFVEDAVELDRSGAEDGTDLQPFIDCFQRRGFRLREGSVDKTNKMFVTMVFTKYGVPRAGKWRGMKWNGKQYQRIEDRGSGQHRKVQGGQRPVEDSEEIDEQQEANLLKPCVYKLR